MKIAYFDTFSGVSGDMTLGAFVSAGVPLDALRGEIAKLNLPGVELDASHIVRSGITAVKLDVVISSPEKKHRHLKDIFNLIDGSALSDRVKRDARRIFEEVGMAEAKVHNTTIEKVHFHEVGALDSIVDIVGAAVCFELAGVEKVYSSPVRLGSGGFIRADHGTMPLPAPATLEILKGYPTVLTDIPFELTTPTGAAIIRAMSSGVLSMETLRVSGVGYGAGTKEIPQVPNLLRVIVGEIDDVSNEEMVVIEANIDDMNPEVHPYVIAKLLEAGAADAWLTPVIMKKGRPGTVLSVLAQAPMAESLSAIIFAETTTIGIRSYGVSRRILARAKRTVRTSLGDVSVKVIVSGGAERLVPEFEECRRLAERHKLPLVQIYRTLERELHDLGAP
jgi:pyridinium-3,5-bisthiocarboxylic acid mononucleotide nickel chelatase